MNQCYTISDFISNSELFSNKWNEKNINANMIDNTLVHTKHLLTNVFHKGKT